LFYLCLGDAPTPYWGSKTPSNVFWFKEIQEMFPKAKFLMLYRDGRDVSVELVDVIWGPTNLYSACLMWQSYCLAMIHSKQYLEPENYHEIYYENLVTNPEKEIGTLCDFLNVPFEPQMLTFHEDTEETFLRQAEHRKTNQPIVTDYVGLYRKLPLSDRQLQVAAIGDTLKQLNYTLEDEPRKIGHWEREWYLEEERHAGTVLQGGVEYKHRAMADREARKRDNIWSDSDKTNQYT
jgi:hypothetical protein